MNKVFESFMAPQLKQFAAYRKQLGYEPDAIRSVLLDFDRYLQKHAVDQSQLTPAFFLKLRASIHEDPNTVNRVLSGLRALFAFLVRQGLYTQNPLDDIPARGQRYFVPFVFTMSQTDQLLQAVCQSIRHQPRYFPFDVALSIYFADGTLRHAHQRTVVAISGNHRVLFVLPWEAGSVDPF